MRGGSEISFLCSCFLIEMHFEQQPTPVLGELWGEWELFSMKHWNARETDAKYHCITCSVIIWNGNTVVTSLDQQVWGCKLLLKQVGSVLCWPLCCSLSGSLGVTGLKPEFLLSPLCISCRFQRWFGLCPSTALLTAPQGAKNQKKSISEEREDV